MASSIIQIWKSSRSRHRISSAFVTRWSSAVTSSWRMAECALLDNRVLYHVIFPGMCGKWFDCLLPIDHYIIETTSFDWFLFLFLHINTVRTTVRDFTMSSCVLWARYKIRIKIFLIVKEVFLLKYEWNCYLWSVKWKSIPRTFVGIVVSAKETKALFTRWI